LNVLNFVRVLILLRNSSSASRLHSGDSGKHRLQTGATAQIRGRTTPRLLSPRMIRAGRMIQSDRRGGCGYKGAYERDWETSKCRNVKTSECSRTRFNGGWLVP